MRATSIRAWVPEVIALVSILFLQSLLFVRGLDAMALYDEGVYLGSLDALLAGKQLGTDVFAAQPPGFYYFLRAAAFVFGNDVESVRTGVLVLGLVGSFGAYVALRVTVGAAAGLLGAAFLVIAPPLPLYSTRVLADLPALDAVLLALAAAALAGSARRAPSVLAAVAGALTVTACSIKLSAAVAAPTVVMLLVRGRPKANLIAATAGAASVAAILLLANVRALPELRESVVDYHSQLREFGSLGGIDTASLWRMVFSPRAAFTWLVVTAAVLAVAHTIRGKTLRVSPFAILAASGLALIVFHKPLFEHHVVAASVGLAVAAAEPIGRALAETTGARRALLAGFVVILLVGGYAQQTRRLTTELAPDDPRVTADIARLAQRTRPGDVVVSDLPILAYRARRPMPANVIDTSRARFLARQLTDSDVLRSVSRYCARAVIVGRSFTTRPDLLRELERQFAVVEQSQLATFFFERKTPCS